MINKLAFGYCLWIEGMETLKKNMCSIEETDRYININVSKIILE